MVDHLNRSAPGARRPGRGRGEAYGQPPTRARRRWDAWAPVPDDRPLDPAALGDHVDRLFRAAWALCGRREDAEDLVQETYARVLARPRRVRDGGELPYLLVALRHTFLSGRRSASRRPVTTALPDDVEPADTRSALRPEDAAGAREVFGHIARCRRRSATRSSRSTSWGCPMVRREGCSTCPRRRSPAVCIAPGPRWPCGWIRPVPESKGSRAMDPELEPLPDEDALAARGRLLVADAVAATQAPLALRERLEAQRTAAAPPRRRLAIFGLAASGLAAIVLVAVLVTGGGSGSSPGGPAVLAVAQVAARAPTGPGAAADRRRLRRRARRPGALPRLARAGLARARPADRRRRRAPGTHGVLHRAGRHDRGLRGRGRRPARRPGGARGADGGRDDLRRAGGGR